MVNVIVSNKQRKRNPSKELDIKVFMSLYFLD